MIGFLGRYFFGTKIHKYHALRREFLREFIVDEQQLQKSLKWSYALETFSIGVQKILPDIILALAGTAAYYGETQGPATAALIGEICRNVMAFIGNYSYLDKEIDDEVKNISFVSGPQLDGTEDKRWHVQITDDNFRMIGAHVDGRALAQCHQGYRQGYDNLLEFVPLRDDGRVIGLDRIVHYSQERGSSPVIYSTDTPTRVLSKVVATPRRHLEAFATDREGEGIFWTNRMEQHQLATYWEQALLFGSSFERKYKELDNPPITQKQLDEWLTIINSGSETRQALAEGTHRVFNSIVY